MNVKDESTAQKMKFSIKGLFSKCDQIRRKLRIWSHLLKKSFMEKFNFCAVLLLLLTFMLTLWMVTNIFILKPLIQNVQRFNILQPSIEFK